MKQQKKQVYRVGGVEEHDEVKKSEAEWKEFLSPEEFDSLRGAATDKAFEGEYVKHYPKSGYYGCKGCLFPLYSFAAKFDSGCGWPSYDRCYFSEKYGCHTKFKRDDEIEGYTRCEITCTRCDGHLGHVFFNEKGKDSERHCVNSRAMKYIDEAEPDWCHSGPIAMIVDDALKNANAF